MPHEPEVWFSANNGGKQMDQQEILKRVDHTLLVPTATWEQVQAVCDQGLRGQTANVCIPPRYVKRAADYVGSQIKICTVVGFPNGYSTPEVKVFETEDAIRNGADEIDMVINLGLAKSGDWEGVLSEIKAVKASCKGRILKVIVEACQLTEEEKVSACRVVSMSGADFIKTSTGFSTGGATIEDVRLFKQNVAPDVRIKAAGGIRTFQQAEAMLEAGADRIGSSALAAEL
jgi:deoxyribose-phosphate aldolase